MGVGWLAIALSILKKKCKKFANIYIVVVIFKDKQFIWEV